MTRPLIVSDVDGLLDVSQTIFNLAKRIQELEHELYQVKITQENGWKK